MADWVVTGQVLVDTEDQFSSINSSAQHYANMSFNAGHQPLVGVQVRVMASRHLGVYASWGTTTTDRDGNFTVTKRRNNKLRYFKVQVKFKSPDLEIRNLKEDTPEEATAAAEDEWERIGPGADVGAIPAPEDTAGIGPLAQDTDFMRQTRGAPRRQLRLSRKYEIPWYTVYASEGRRRGPSVDTGTHTLRPGDYYSERELVVRHRQTIAWYVSEKVRDALRARGSWLAFKKKVRVMDPANTPSAYANGVNNTVYISERYWGVDTVVHEIMHLWNYQHNHGTSNWLQAICDGSTHSEQERPAIAFHEGFAEYAMEDLLHNLWGFQKLRPYSRFVMAGIFATKMGSPAILEGSDIGVTGALHLLTTSDIYSLTFGPASTSPISSGATSAYFPIKRRVRRAARCPDEPNLDLWDVLTAFRASPNDGWDNDWEVGNKDYGVLRFFDRVSDIFPSFDQEAKDLCLELLDASSTVEPRDSCEPIRLFKR